MSKPRRARFVALIELLARQHPKADSRAISDGRVVVDGRYLMNPAALVRADARIVVEPLRRLRGQIKLDYALDAFSVDVDGRVAIDIGASAGGFTTALIERGATRVYAVDVGMGQLANRLRADERVVNLEGHNLAVLSPSVVPEHASLITMDLSYLAVADAIPQLAPLRMTDDAEIIILVKPTFELRRASVANADDDMTEAILRASKAITLYGWTVEATCPAPITGRGSAGESFIYGTRTRAHAGA